MKLSIITINKNNFEGLEKTIVSVIGQTYSDFEYIIIDGASTDGSIDIIKKYSDKINYWVSEADPGIYNAMNKGIRIAKGEFCLFLNSGDSLISSDTLINVFNEISSLPTSDIYYSDRINSDGQIFRFPKSLTTSYLIEDVISHQNSLIKRALFYEHEFYNENLKLASDREFFLNEMWKYKSKFTYIKTNISIFDPYGLGSQDTPLRRVENKIFFNNVFGEISEYIIELNKELNKYRGTVYGNIIENFGSSFFLTFLLRLYRLIIRRVLKLNNIFKKILSCFLPQCLLQNLFIYIKEYFLSIFTKKIRICFTNFGDIPYDFFTVPIKKTFEVHNLSYRIVNYYKPHINFFSVFGSKKKLKSSKALCKIFFTGENVNRIDYIQYKGNCIDSVDLSMGFDYVDSGNYLRFPLWLLYYFKPFNTIDDVSNILALFKNTYRKTKFCSLVASHDNSGIRAKMFSDLSAIAHIDCAGVLLHNDTSLHNIYDNNKSLYLQQYKFNICPENSISPGYVTEKLFQSLYSGCIPIYNGWSKDPEPDIVNPNIILWYDESDEQNNKYAMNEVRKLHENDKLYRSFVEQPFFCDTAVDKIYTILQQYTDKLQSVISNTLTHLKRV
ncbi:MAG: glycosyltransferase [Spirochaetaceae bacterium]|nr:glycosyltransferase [Spirochaetaceae bacterium]